MPPGWAGLLVAGFFAFPAVDAGDAGTGGCLFRLDLGLRLFRDFA